MILYYALTLHQQIACMLHKQLYAVNEEAHLYLSNGNNIEESSLERLRESGFFSKVSVMDDQPTWSLNVTGDLSNKEVLDGILEEVTKICYKSLIVPIEEYSDIYVAADHFPFGMAMVFNKIPYHYIEEATGVYCTYHLWQDIVYKQNIKLSYNVSKIYGLAGRADCVIERLIDIDKQFEPISEKEYEGVVDFSLPKMLKRIDNETVKRILNCFELNEKLHIDSNDMKNAIIMTEYLAHAKFCTWDEQREIYGRFIDYFCEGLNVLIKPHPNDYQGIYEEWFPQCTQIDKSIPAELLPLIVEGGIDLCIALTSTSVYVLQENLDKTYTFRNGDLRSIKMIQQMDYYYVVVNMLINLLPDKTIWCLGSDSLQVKYFVKNNRINNCKVFEKNDCEITSDDSDKIIVVDMLNYTNGVGENDIHDLLRSAGEKDVFVFLNSNNDVLFYDDEKNFIEHIVPVCVNSIKSNGTEIKKYIYFYTKEGNMQKEILTKKIDKMLENAGIRIQVNCDDKTVRERVLEGMLEATEQKCNMLIKRK